MPRKLKLTWQPGANGRSGRWRKKYKGNIHHFSGGRGKSDRDAYEAALTAWENKKVRLDAKAPKPHEADYLRAIEVWEAVLTWCRQHGDDYMANLATENLKRLRDNLAAQKPAPVREEDTFEGRFVEDVRYPGLKELRAEMADVALAGAKSQEWTHSFAQFVAQNESNPSKAFIDPSQFESEFIDPLKNERIMWRDRLDVMQRDVPRELTLKSFVERYVEEKSESAKAGELSAARVYSLRLHLNLFADWSGHNTHVVDINGQVLSDFRIELLRKVKSEWSPTTANDHLTTVKSFIRWLWQIEAIPTLPRIMDGKSTALRIGKSAPEIVVFTKSEIATLLEKASSRTRLYILLMLNCGMTQKDIADLQQSEINWEAGRVTRKRSKTRKHENVPEVCYALWQETLYLLKDESSPAGSGPVLLNENGGPIWWDELTTDGKYRKNDNIKNAFHRLRNKTKIKKPLKSLKKTSATLIRGSAEFASLEGYFLGHSGKSIAHRHYAQQPQNLLDDAIAWLATEYSLS